MAFKTTVTRNRITLADAYCRAYVTLCTSDTVRVEVDIWDSAQSRKDCPSEPNFHDTHVFPIERELSSDNPLDYAYKMLEQSGKYPDATWNV